MIEKLIYYPDLPKIPDGFLETIDAYDPNEVLAVSLGDGDLPSPSWLRMGTLTPHRSATKDGVSIPNASYQRHPVNEKITNWIKQNIASDYTDFGISFHGKTGSIALPHTDKTRNWTLMWLLDEGGPEVDTVYWQEENYPVIRNTHPLGPDSYDVHWAAPTSYDNLKEVGRVRLKCGRWHLITTQALHSVEGITAGPRKSLQIGFWDNSESIQRFKAISTNM